MGCLGKMLRKVLNWIACVLQVACAIAIIYILTQKLYRVDPPSVTSENNIRSAANSTVNGGNAANSTASDFVGNLLSPLTNTTAYNDTCYLSENGEEQNACHYTIFVVSITFLASIALSIIQCLTCDCCGAGWIFDTILSIVLCGFWIALSVLISRDNNTINSMEPPPIWDTDAITTARETVMYLSWVEAALFGFTALLGLMGMCPSSEDRYRDK